MELKDDRVKHEALIIVIFPDVLQNIVDKKSPKSACGSRTFFVPLVPLEQVTFRNAAQVEKMSHGPICTQQPVFTLRLFEQSDFPRRVSAAPPPRDDEAPS